MCVRECVIVLSLSQQEAQWKLAEQSRPLLHPTSHETPLSIDTCAKSYLLLKCITATHTFSLPPPLPPFSRSDVMSLSYKRRADASDGHDKKDRGALDEDSQVNGRKRQKQWQDMLSKKRKSFDQDETLHDSKRWQTNNGPVQDANHATSLSCDYSFTTPPSPCSAPAPFAPLPTSSHCTALIPYTEHHHHHPYANLSLSIPTLVSIPHSIHLQNEKGVNDEDMEGDRLTATKYNQMIPYQPPPPPHHPHPHPPFNFS